MVLSDPPGGAQTVKNKHFSHFAEFMIFLVFLFFLFPRNIFMRKRKIFLKTQNFTEKSQKSLQAARWPKVFVFLLFRSSIFIHFHDFP